MNNYQTLPVVLCFSGLDSTGGAGLQADIEAILSMGCHAAPVATALTIQDTHRVHDYTSVDGQWLQQQARAILEDMDVAAIKIGMLGDHLIIDAIDTILADYAEIPVVLDPVMAGGGGGELSDTTLGETITRKLLPRTTVVTPNTLEAHALIPAAETLDSCGQGLLECGCEYALLTGTHEETEHVENRLYAQGQLLETFTWDRLPHNYHGSGCTLAASIAGMLAQGLEAFTAIHEAQEYTWETLKQAYRVGQGQLLPNRLFWARGEDEDVPQA